MAVYTPITNAELDRALFRFGLSLQGQPCGASEGIENTTYFLSASAVSGEAGEFVLTILENTSPAQMQYSAALCSHLAMGGLPVPAPLKDPAGHFSFSLSGKPALLFPRASGAHPRGIGQTHCQIMGDFLARAHQCAESFTGLLKNTRGLEWMIDAGKALHPFLTEDDRALLQQQIARYQALVTADPALSGGAIPTGAIHGDLFTDNSLFVGDRLSGVIDFYNACTDWLLLDVAIAVNDWCVQPGRAALDPDLTRSFLNAYHQVRPFSPSEHQHWQGILCIAATRFWVSRLLGHCVPEMLGGAVHTKNPAEYRSRLVRHLESVPPLPCE